MCSKEEDSEVVVILCGTDLLPFLHDTMCEVGNIYFVHEMESRLQHRTFEFVEYV